MTPAEGVADRSSSSLLGLEEAVRLCHVLVAHSAGVAGVRVFFIKGPASGEMGLRPAKTSIDVDAFVSVNDMPALLMQLASRGWQTRPSASELDGFPRHSETLYHDSWPNNIDVHYRFPGMDMPPAACFEVLYAETQEFIMANQLIRVPSLELGVVIAALHALRTPTEAAEQRALSFLHGLPLQLHKNKILQVAQKCRATAALRSFLTQAFGEDCLSHWPEPGDDWKNLTRVSAPGAGWAVAFSTASWRKRPRMLVEAMFPSKRALLGADLYADVSIKGRFLARARRWQVFFLRFPSLVENIGLLWKSRRRP